MRAAASRREIVAADERETGERALLNFGHTFGHAIEVGTGYGTWLHGEAVAAGMVLAGELSVRVTGMPPRRNERLRQLCPGSGCRSMRRALGVDRYLGTDGPRQRRSRQGELRLVLLEALGRATIRADIPLATAEPVLRRFSASRSTKHAAPNGAACVSSPARPALARPGQVHVIVDGRVFCGTTRIADK